MVQMAVTSLLVCALAVAVVRGVPNTAGDLLPQVYEAVQRIAEYVRKEDQINKLAQFFAIDSSLKALDRKVDTLLERSREVQSGRAGPTDMDERLEKLESTVAALQFSVAKMERGLDQQSEADQQRMDDLDQKLRKMTNVITSLYEMNKEMKKEMGTKTSGTPPATAADFLLANLDQLERNLKEQMSVISMETRRELSTLKQVTYAITERCDSRPPEDDSRQKSLGPEVGDALLNSLEGSTREIKEQLLTIGDMLAAINRTGDCDSAPSTAQPVDRPRQDKTLQPVDKPPQAIPSLDVLFPTSCASLQKGAGAFNDGVYVIFIRSTRAVRVYCDMATDGGGWTVIMRRGDFGPKQISFNQNWNGYKDGFGDVEGEFWLGNDNIHALTSQENNTLQVRLESFGGDSLVLNYNYFAVEGEDKNYRMRLGRPIGRPSAATNALRHHNNQPFSTYDRKNNEFDGNCASRYKGGWWFNSRCYHAFLTGEYFGPEERRDRWRGILWYDWKKDEALKSAEMLIRPTNTN